MSSADPSDVQAVISTDLSTSEIQPYLDDALFEAQEAIDDYADEWSSERKTQLEKYLAALKIRQYRDRAMNMGRRESAQINYEGKSIAALKREVDKRDPTGQLAYRSDTDRYVGST